MATTNFIVKDKKLMYDVFEKLHIIGLINERDFGVVKVATHLPSAQVANFWILSNKLSLPLVKKVLLQFRLAKL